MRLCAPLNSFKRQPLKMVKRTHWQQPTNCWSVFNHFVGLVLKGFKLPYMTKKLLTNVAFTHLTIHLTPDSHETGRKLGLYKFIYINFQYRKSLETLSWLYNQKHLSGVTLWKRSKKFRKIHRKTPALESLFNKVASLGLRLY